MTISIQSNAQKQLMGPSICYTNRLRWLEFYYFWIHFEKSSFRIISANYD